MKIYNTLTRQKEEFVPLTPGEVRMYACGPTVYNYFHIGNARPFSLFDTLRRYLEYRGNKVRFVQNFTDVDDKIINKANEEGVPAAEVADRYIKEYWVDAEGLNIRPATAHPRVSETIPEIVAMVEALIAKGHAYEVDGDVYFSTKSFEGYGKLSHQPLDDLEAGARIMVGEVKREPMDFALWKAAKPGEPAWESPWGPGRPGWHIECSAMAKKYLGPTIDLHCGGQDLVFPHHENEIAQSECANGVPFANYWMHNGFIDVNCVKMSKSLGNFFTVREVAKVYGYEPVRYLMIACHYRSPFNYSVESVEQAKAALQRLRNCRKNLADSTVPLGSGDLDLSGYKEKFDAAMEDDFNTANALGVVFEMVREINTHLNSASKQALQDAAALFDTLTDVLGFDFKPKNESIDAEIEALIAERAQARKEKNWARADEIRAQIGGMGYTIEDTPQGTKIVR